MLTLLLVFVFFLLAVYRLRLAAVVLPLLFPLYLVKTVVFHVPFNVLEGGILSIAVVWAVKTVYGIFRKHSFKEKLLESFARLRFWKNKDGRFFNWKILLILAAIIAAGIVSSLITAPLSLMGDGSTLFYGRIVALGIVKSWLVLPILMLVMWRLILNNEDWHDLFDSYFFSAIILSAWAFWQFISGQFVTVDGRASGPFESANYLAFYLTPALLYGIVYSANVWKTFKLSHQVAAIALVGLNFVALIFTKSYAAFLALCVALVLIAVFYYWPKICRGFRTYWKEFLGGFLGLVILSFFVGLTLFVIDPVKWHQFTEFNQRSSSAVRVEVYTVALQLIKEHPILGIGPGQFPLYYQLNAPRILGHVPYEWNIPHPHNIFFAFWLNLGLLGLLSFLAIIWFVGVRVSLALKVWDRKELLSRQFFQVLAFGMFLTILVHGVFDTTFFKNDLSVLFWMICLPLLW